MSGFTEGPWHILGENLDAEIEVLASTSLETVCLVLPAAEAEGGAAYADAALIAAAPDLYEALHGLANFVEVVLPRNQSYHETPAMRARLDMARAALAKAAPEKETE